MYDSILEYKDFTSLSLEPIKHKYTQNDLEDMNFLYKHFNHDFSLYSIQKFIRRYFGPLTGIRRLIIKWLTSLWNY